MTPQGWARASLEITAQSYNTMRLAYGGRGVWRLQTAGMTRSLPALSGATASHVPSWSRFFMEPVRAAFEYGRMATMPRAAPRRGDGHAVIVFPGLASNQRATAPLVSFCEDLGFRACDWGLGFNVGPRGDIDQWLSDLSQHVEGIRSRVGGSMTLIGWSLGGIYAREVAKLLPGRVRQVITIGTPFAGTETSTRVGWLYRLVSGQPARMTSGLARRLARSPGVPTTSIYSRSDGVVAWEACVQPDGRQRENIEVQGSHCGMAWNPDVLSIVADRLAQQDGAWRKYQPPRVGANSEARWSLGSR